MSTRLLFAATFSVLSLTALDPSDVAVQAPSCDAPEHRAFDFWVGSWRVTDSTGAVAGRNRISRAHNNCVLHEQWTASDGSTGSSFNLYDRYARRWHQTWVDGNGLLLQLDGGLVNGSMVLTGDRINPRGGLGRHRITWTPRPDGTVVQHWERSADSGATWVTQFKGTYSRTR